MIQDDNPLDYEDQERDIMEEVEDHEITLTFRFRSTNSAAEVIRDSIGDLECSISELISQCGGEEF